MKDRTQELRSVRSALTPHRHTPHTPYSHTLISHLFLRSFVCLLIDLFVYLFVCLCKRLALHFSRPFWECVGEMAPCRAETDYTEQAAKAAF